MGVDCSGAEMEWTCHPLLLCLLLSLPSISGVLANDEGDALISLKTNLEDPNDMMDDWDKTLATPCTWSHIACANGSVVKINLPNSGLSGTLASELNQLKNLTTLELYNNSIGGIIPVEIGNLKSLVNLDLYSNKFSGQIPETLGNLKDLRFLRLNNNNLSGQIPKSLTNLSVLQVLNLSNNNLSGEVPSSGSFSQFNITSFANNPSLCGSVISVSCPTSPSQPVASGKSSSYSAVVAGVVAGALLLSAVGLAWWYHKKSEEYFFDVPGEEDLKGQPGQVKRFSFEELQVATDNFSNKHILGRGGFAIVYKGRLADGSLVAIKRLKKESIRCEEFQFQTEVQMFSRAVHMNLLRLRGYCTTVTERLLVYPCMANGSVASCLREGMPSKTPLDWPTRRRIALASAKVLSYLHDHCDPKIIHRDVKAANILLDEKFEPFLGDFGLARLMDYKDTNVTTVVRGTIGHIAPEYLFTQKFSEKTDVFGYGVMLLELITGQRAFDLARVAHEDEIVLQEWVKMHVKEKNLKALVDPNLEDNYVDIEVEELTWIALICTQNTPTERPTMSEVVRMLEADCHFEKWEEWQKFEMMHQKLAPEWQYYQPQIPHSTSTCNLVVQSSGVI